MDTLDYDFFFAQLKAGKCIEETCFYFLDDIEENEHYLGFLPEYDKPYWIGYCDIPDGAEFYTAEELVNASVFDNRSIKSRWETVRIAHIEGTCLSDRLKYFEHV